MRERDSKYLIKKLIENKLTSDELDDFLERFGDEDAEEDYTGYLKVFFDDIIEEAVSNQIDSKILQEASEITKEKQPVIRKLWSRPWINAYRWAAAIALLLSSYYFFRFMSEEPILQKQVIAEVPVFIEKEASPGSKLRLNLNDGSFIHLNSASKLTIPNKFNIWERHIDLVGEAYFRVARDESRPFIIATKNLIVEVLGTSFNVRAYEDEEDISVTVETGKVLVKLSNNDIQSSVLLVKGQKVVFNHITGKIRECEIDPYNDICWTKGILKFNKTRLAEVERVLERWYNVNIEVTDSAIYSNKLNGEHHNKSLKSVLESLKFALKIDYEMKGNHVQLK